MRPNSWTKINSVDSGKEYLALLSYLPVKKYRTIPAVISSASKIDKQLRVSKGLIGFSFQAEVFKKQFWTLSVWENRDDLNEFVINLPHKDVMSELSPHMKKTKFVFWKMTGSEIPPGWDQAKRRLGTNV